MKKFSRYSQEHEATIPDFAVLDSFEIEIKSLRKLCTLLKTLKTPEIIRAVKNYITLRSAGVIENELRACIPEIIDPFHILAARAMSQAWSHKPELVVPIDGLDKFTNTTKGRIVLMQFDIPNANNVKAVFSGINNVKDFFLWFGDLFEIPPVMVKNRKTKVQHREGGVWKRVNDFVIARNDMIHNLTNEEKELDDLELSIKAMQGFVTTAFTITCINLAIEQDVDQKEIIKCIRKLKTGIFASENHKQILDKFIEITKQHKQEH